MEEKRKEQGNHFLQVSGKEVSGMQQHSRNLFGNEWRNVGSAEWRMVQRANKYQLRTVYESGEKIVGQEISLGSGSMACSESKACSRIFVFQ